MMEQGPTGDGPTPVFVERVATRDVSAWIANKQLGPGRDRRLSTVRPLAAASVSTPLFRDAQGQLTTGWTPPARIFGTSPAALPEILSGISASGLEPQSYAEELIRLIGVNTRSGLAQEIRHTIYTLWSAVCLDGLDVQHSVAFEHMGRRLLQVQRAISKNPKAPSFTGLEGYMEHMSTAAAGMKTPGFDKWVAEDAKTKALILRQLRLAQEEQDPAPGTGTGGKNGKRNKKGGKDDDPVLEE